MTNSKIRRELRAKKTKEILQLKDVRIAELEAKLALFDDHPRAVSVDGAAEPKMAALEMKVQHLTERLENSEKSRLEASECLRKIKLTISNNFGKRAVDRFVQDKLTPNLVKECTRHLNQDPVGLRGSTEFEESKTREKKTTTLRQEAASLSIDDSVTDFALKWTTSSGFESKPKTSTPNKFEHSVNIPSFTMIEERHSF